MKQCQEIGKIGHNKENFDICFYVIFVHEY